MWRRRNARALGLHEVVVLGRSLMGKFGEEGGARPPPDAELWEKNVGALAEAFEAVRPMRELQLFTSRVTFQANPEWHAGTADRGYCGNKFPVSSLKGSA